MSQEENSKQITLEQKIQSAHEEEEKEEEEEEVEVEQDKQQKKGEEGEAEEEKEKPKEEKRAKETAKKEESSDEVKEKEDEENDKEEENNEEEKELMDEKVEKDKKIDMNNIKFINQYKSEEQIKKAHLNNNIYNKEENEDKKIQFYEIKINKRGFKLKELAIDTQYNDLKAKQNELNESDNKLLFQVKIIQNINIRNMIQEKKR